jgi:signal transduction histidine kinase/CheY-like chemotaxis protein
VFETPADRGGRVSRRVLAGRVITLSPVARYGFAVAAAVGAIVLRLAFDPIWGSGLPFMTFYPAIILSAWVGGLWPGIVTTLIGAAAAEYFWLDPEHVQVGKPGDLLALLMFTLVGIGISALNEAWRRGAALLAASEKELERVLDVIPAAVWVARDPDCREVFGNRNAAALFGVPEATNVSQTPGNGHTALPIRHFRDGRELAPKELPMQRAAATGLPQPIDELEVSLPDGGRRTLLGGAMPLLDEAGTVRGVVSAFSDITDRKEIEAQRAELLAREQTARADVERASRLKDEFLAVLSHELRTPLNAVLGYAHLLASGALPAERASHALEAIQRNAQAQARLVESLLDLSRVIAGKLELDRARVDLSKIIDVAVDVIRPDSDAKDIALDVMMPAGDVSLVGDAGRLQQVLWNLLSNAIKFTPKGGRVGLQVVQQDSKVRIEITDTGNGISAEFLPHVFDRFRQGNNHKGTAPAGLGLGLAVVRELVQAHGGTIAADSPGEGRGSTFTVLLPLNVGAATWSEATIDLVENDGAEGSLHDLRILVADDDGDVRDLLSLLLESRGATVRTVASASEVLEALNNQPADLLLADLRMPEEDGYSLIRRLREGERGRGNGRLPAIAVTAYASTTDRDRAIEAGYDRHVAKPIDLADLVRAIAQCAMKQKV